MEIVAVVKEKSNFKSEVVNSPAKSSRKSADADNGAPSLLGIFANLIKCDIGVLMLRLYAMTAEPEREKS